MHISLSLQPLLLPVQESIAPCRWDGNSNLDYGDIAGEGCPSVKSQWRKASWIPGSGDIVDAGAVRLDRGPDGGGYHKADVVEVGEPLLSWLIDADIRSLTRFS